MNCLFLKLDHKLLNLLYHKIIKDFKLFSLTGFEFYKFNPHTHIILCSSENLLLCIIMISTFVLAMKNCYIVCVLGTDFTRMKVRKEESDEESSSTQSFIILGLIFLAAIVSLGVVYLNFPNLDPYVS